MSHKATKWAWKQRGLKPAPRLVLVCLADHYNPDMGCFPSQALIAFECEISRASVNTHLDYLEGRALISRVASVDPKTYQQRPTRYYLAFEEGFKPVAGAVSLPVDKQAGRVQKLDTGPCPKNGKSRVQNLDTNLVKDNNRNTRTHTRERPGHSTLSVWTGDPAVRAAVADDPQFGEGPAISYIDTAMPLPGNGLRTKTRLAYDRLQGCEPLKRLGVTIEPP